MLSFLSPISFYIKSNVDPQLTNIKPSKKACNFILFLCPLFLFYLNQFIRHCIVNIRLIHANAVLSGLCFFPP